MCIHTCVDLAIQENQVTYTYSILPPIFAIFALIRQFLIRIDITQDISPEEAARGGQINIGGGSINHVRHCHYLP